MTVKKVTANLYVEDVRSCVKFWERLGFEKTMEVPDGDKLAFVSAGHIKFDEDAFKADQTFIAAMIHYEVDTDLFGSSEARRNLVKNDPQAAAAQQYFDEAAKLLQLKK